MNLPWTTRQLLRADDVEVAQTTGKADNGPEPFNPGDVSGVGGCGCQSGGELTLLLSAVALFVRRRRAQ